MVSSPWLPHIILENHVNDIDAVYSLTSNKGNKGAYLAVGEEKLPQFSVDNRPKANEETSFSSMPPCSGKA